MKVSGGLEEEGVVIGNTYDKYNSGNPLVRKIMQGFDGSLSDFISKAAPDTIHEVGCGEGFWVMQWNKEGMSARGSDFSSQIIEIARTNAKEQNLSMDLFKVRSVYDLMPANDTADLIVCCEVLEHLEFPEQALKALQKVVGQRLILSVPREPIWCALNLARGKYFPKLGNTPGHIQHWSKRSFIKLISKYFKVIEVKNPLPWTMLLCRPL
jgi:2-polyprenyl-3-methyl-5-hydroxy-6-metoxy-1,4-benzoquinol methylase